MRNSSACFRFAILLFLSLNHGTLAQTSATWTFPVEDGTTINLIDTIYFQWTSNYAQAYIYFWCQNDSVIGNDVVLANSFPVDTSGRYGYVLSKEAPGETTFPVACQALLVPTPNGSGANDPVGVTFTSQLNVAAETFSLTTSATTSTTPTFISQASTVATILATMQASMGTTTQKPTGTTMMTITSISSESSNTALLGGPLTSTAGGLNVTKSMTTSNSLGAFIGGAIGGAFLMCFIIFVIIFLRKYNRPNKHNAELNRDSRRRNSSRWWPERRTDRTTPIQVAGLHEKDGSGVSGSRFEKEGDRPGFRAGRFEKEGDRPGVRAGRFEKEGSVPKRPPRPQTIAELPG